MENQENETFRKSNPNPMREVKCPNCKNKVQVHYKINPYSTENRVFECPICHEKMKNKDNREWEILTKSRKIEYILIWLTQKFLIAFFAFAFIAILFTIGLTFFMDEEAVKNFTVMFTSKVGVIAILVIFAFLCYKTYPTIKDDIENSKVRLKDRAYVKALKKVGYTVPDKYL